MEAIGAVMSPEAAMRVGGRVSKGARARSRLGGVLFAEGSTAEAIAEVHYNQDGGRGDGHRYSHSQFSSALDLRCMRIRARKPWPAPGRMADSLSSRALVQTGSSGGRQALRGDLPRREEKSARRVIASEPPRAETSRTSVSRSRRSIEIPRNRAAVALPLATSHKREQIDETNR
jgi:hypothetical protein